MVLLLHVLILDILSISRIINVIEHGFSLFLPICAGEETDFKKRCLGGIGYNSPLRED